jgi:hypothetical protein
MLDPDPYQTDPKHCLAKPRVKVAFDVLLLDEALLALRALEHLAEGEGDVGGAVPLRLVVGRPGLDVRAQRASE